MSLPMFVIEQLLLHLSPLSQTKHQENKHLNFKKYSRRHENVRDVTVLKMMMSKKMGGQDTSLLLAEKINIARIKHKLQN